MSGRRPAGLGVLLALSVLLGGCTGSGPSSLSTSSAPAVASSHTGRTTPSTVAARATNVYAAAGARMLAPAVAHDRPMVYVPDTLSDWVDVIDPRTYRVVDSFRVGHGRSAAVAQHVVPSYDLRTLWVNESGADELTPIDPRTGRHGKPVAVADPYNLYFTPGGAHAMVMAERLRRIDFRDPHTMRLQRSLPVPCRGVNHADFTADLKTFLASCEFTGVLLEVPADGSRIAKVLDLNAIRTPGTYQHMPSARGGPVGSLDPGASAMPQDVRLTPDGTRFVSADMYRGGVWVVDARTFTVQRFIPTGFGAHGIYPSRDGTVLYVSNRDEGSITVLDARTLAIRTKWRLPGGGSPDMGGVTADGTQLWLSGRSDAVVYVIDTRTGKLLHKIKVHPGPHGLCVWPQPGRFSLGHTGNMR